MVAGGGAESRNLWKKRLNRRRVLGSVGKGSYNSASLSVPRCNLLEPCEKILSSLSGCLRRNSGSKDGLFRVEGLFRKLSGLHW